MSVVSGVKKQKRSKRSISVFTGTEDILPIGLSEFAVKSTKIYGSYTIEQRALSDYRDGLKPVHRRILWAMYGLGLHNNGSFKKCARTIGDVIGKYHPHGDTAAYQALVSAACSVGRSGNVDWTNSACPLVDGQGNFGGKGVNDRAAAQRYTEAKLSKFADFFMLDPDYLAVSTMVPNFDGEEKEPVILPAKLPYLLLGGCEGIACGVSTYIPTFSTESLIKLLKKAILQNKAINSKMCAKYLKFKFSNGGICTSSDADILSYFKTGKGTLTFTPEWSEQGDLIQLKSLVPRFNLEDKKVKKGKPPKLGKLSKLATIPGVVSASDDSDRRTGLVINIALKKRMQPKEKMQVVKAVEKEITSSLSFQTAVTERLDDGETVKFRYTTIPKILNDWIIWRTELECKVIQYLIGKSEKELERLSLLQLAAKNIDTMKKMLDSKDPVQFLIKTLKLNGKKLTEAQANFLIDIRFRQITKLSREKLLKDIATVNAKIKDLHAHLRNPTKRILASFSQ